MAIGGVNAVKAGYDAAQAIKNKPLTGAKKGALIGAGVQVGTDVLALSIASKQLGGADKFFGILKEMGISKGKYAALAAVGVASTAAMGALIGKIVDVVKNHKAQKAE